MIWITPNTMETKTQLYLSCISNFWYLSVDIEHFRSLSLSPALDGNADIMEGCSIIDCLERFTALEHLENFRCGRCWHIGALKYLSVRADKDEMTHLLRLLLRRKSKLQRLPVCCNLSHSYYLLIGCRLVKLGIHAPQQVSCICLLLLLSTMEDQEVVIMQHIGD
ncbi:hypothetical protein BHE74_00006716 [Ensete ventricosum]|nr:hypothetical protein GW17_00028944 [Ensete ventricosum]RWW84664.1 hypothetical protein BHE74_00006716 [Ensete ventricosum]